MSPDRKRRRGLLSVRRPAPTGCRLPALAAHAEGSAGRLKSLGVGFAIDDYGGGCSCLRYLEHTPIGYPKIDRSFVAGLGEDLSDAAIVSSTIELARALGLKAVSEGEEAEERSAKLKELGCDPDQGFYFVEPLVSEAISGLLADDRWPKRGICNAVGEREVVPAPHAPRSPCPR